MKLTADVHVLHDRTDAAEIKTAHRRKTAREVILEDRSLRPGEAELRLQGQHLTTGTVGTLAEQKVLAGLDVGSREVVLAESKIEVQRDTMTFGGDERAVAGVVHDAEFPDEEIGAAKRRG